jgi:tetratricopeptide (TPR) repeat protein
MGPKTWRRLAIAAVVLVLGVVSIVALQRYQVSRLGESNLVKAAEAEKAGDLEEAEGLYLQHVKVFPEDFDAQVSFARVLLERSQTPARVGQAMQIYKDVLAREPGRDDVRRSLVKLQVEAMGEKGDSQQGADARANLSVLQRNSPGDADLAYLMGRCRQAEGQDQEALKAYQEAVAGKSKDRFDARQRMATLYRGEGLNSPADADRVIDEMVKEEPDDFRTHLARGRYRLQFLKPDEDPSAAEADFREAIRLAPAEADPYLELSRLALRRTPPDLAGAEEVLAQGLKAAPKSGRIHLTSAMLKLNAGDRDGGLKALRAGLETLPDDASLRVTIADVLATQGATTELRDQVQELYRIGLRAYGDFYAAYALVNARQWSEAKKVLLEKLATLDLSANDPLRAGVSRLLAQCYGNLGDVERQRSYLAGAVRDAPGDLASRMGWINGLVEQGETDRAISEYRALADSSPDVRPPLAALLIDRNGGLEPARRDWKEVEGLIAQIARDEPSSSVPAVLTARMKAAQGLRDEAVTLLDAARAKAPKDRAAVQLWINSADLKALRRDFAGAMKLIDEAQASFGDSQELRMARLKYLLVQGGPDVDAELVAASKDLDALPIDQRVVVLDAVGAALAARGAQTEANDAWRRAGELAPNDIRPRLQALGLTLDAKPDLPPAEVERFRAEAEKLIADIRRIEGPDGYMARLAEIELLTWRLARTADAAEKAQLRADARAALGELRSRRPDWSVIPLATARLDELELDQAKDDDDRRRRLGRLADLYRQAIEMGQHSLPVVRRATELLMESGRTAEVSQLWSKVPALGGDSSAATNIEKSILQRIVGEKNFDDAEAIVRQRIATRPNDFAERAMLVQILIWNKKFDEAETELRQAVAADPADPDRRILLIEFLVATNKIDQAEQAFATIERAVRSERLPQVMAACADLIAQGSQATGRDAQKARWVATAKDWHKKAQAAKPDDFTRRRAYVEFLLRMNLVDDVETELTAILKAAGPASGVDPADLAWARRTLALTHVARSELSGDYQQALKALYLYAPPDKTEDKLPEEVEDLRVLARVYAAQRIVSYRTKAAEILKKLVDEQRASEDDRYLLARIYKADGDWDKARAELRELVREERRPTSARDLTQQVGRLAYFASELIDRIQSPVNDADVAEAQALIDRLKAFQPDSFNVLALQARLDKARGKDAEALAAIKVIADRPQVPPALARALGGLAEKVGLLDEAEAILKRNATASPRLEDQLEYAVFLGRRGRIKDALDVCEPIWNASPNPEPATPAVVSILLSEQSFNDPDQIARVSGWIERALQRTPDAPLLNVALGTIRDRQERYSEAMDLYRKVLAKNASEIVPLNNLAWLMTLQGDKGADPLKLINRAIQLRGPVSELLDTRAVVYTTNGDYQKAIKDLEDAVAIDPAPSRYFHLARAYLAAGDEAAARLNFTKARDAGLKESDVHPLERPALAQVEKALK